MNRENHERPEEDSSRRLVFERALRLLAGRDHSQAELRTKLRQRLGNRGISEALIETVLEQLCQDGSLDDTRFTFSYIRLAVEKGWGSRKISYYLQKKGVTASQIQQGLSEYDDAFWTQQASALLKRKYAKTPEDASERNSRIRFLLGRGFSFEQIQNAMQDIDKEQIS